MVHPGESSMAAPPGAAGTHNACAGPDLNFNERIAAAGADHLSGIFQPLL